MGGDEKVNKTYDHVDWEKYVSNIPQPNESESNRNKMDVALDFPDDHTLDGEMKESE